MSGGDKNSYILRKIPKKYRNTAFSCVFSLSVHSLSMLTDIKQILTKQRTTNEPQALYLLKC